MPHSCTKCSKVYPDKSEAILRGCSCGSRVFYFIKAQLPVNGAAGQIEQHRQVELMVGGKEERSAIETAIDDIAANATDKTIIIEPGMEADAVENIRVMEPGAYYINVPSLMKGGPVVLRSDADVYYIRLPEPKKANNGQQRRANNQQQRQ